jgi:FF domain
LKTVPAKSNFSIYALTRRQEIPGAEPWIQVTTKWSRTFYHNPTTNESYWNAPEQIQQIVERVQLEIARAEAAESDYDSEEEDEDDFPDDAKPADIPVEFTEDDIAYQLALMQGDYGGDEEMVQEEPELDSATKREIFISLLEEKDVNPFNTWEKEVDKIVHDPRYSMLNNTKQRMEIFRDWARARIALIKEEKKDEVKEDVCCLFV